MPEAHDARLRVEHAQVIRKEDVRLFAELGIIASMQPSHASDDMRWADARLGAGRVDGAYAWRWFRDAKVPLAFGSDFPVEIVNPFWGIYAAITRADAEGNPRAAGTRSSGSLWKRLSAGSRLGQRTQPLRKTGWGSSGLACRPT